MITDSHCHLTCEELYDQADELIENALNEGVDQMLVMCTNRKEFERARELAARYPKNLKVAFGYFPGDAKEITEADLDYLEQAAMNHEMDVLGEIGLDYHWDTSFKDEQKQLFIRQIEIANKAGLPISIHMRDASRDSLDLLEEHARTPIIFHCFSGSLPIMQEALKLNSFISFAGPVTYKNNKTGPVNVQNCPLDRLLTETDSPYLAPVPYRGKTNQPAYVKATAEKIAQLKDVPVQTVHEAVRQNYNRLFQPGA